MIRVLIFFILIGCRSITNGASIDDLTASHVLTACHLHDYGELEIPSEDRDALVAWAMERGLSGFNAVENQATTGCKAIALFDITAPDEEFFEISLSALKKYSEQSLPESYLSAILMPTERKRGLIAICYRDERLRSVLEKCQQRLSVGSPLANLIKLTLNGEQAKSVVKHAGDGGFPERYGPLAKEALSGKVPNLADRKSDRPIPMIKTTSQQSSNRTIPSDEGSILNEHKSPPSWMPWTIGALAVIVVFWSLMKRRP